jgi:hypothetical protein
MSHERLDKRAGAVCMGLLLMVATGCALTTDDDTGRPVPTTSTSATALMSLGPGQSACPRSGWFSFSDPALAGPIRIACSFPAAGHRARVLIVMPGAQRNARDYLADWRASSLASSTIVLVPELPRDRFSEDVYNLGGVLDEDGEETEPSTWIYGFLERLFAQVVEASGSSATTYDVFGHSAGAQFVHRFVQLDPHPHLGTAVAANAGWYLVPDDDESFPYGLHGIPPDEDDLSDAFHSRLVVLLGADDVDEDDELLRHDSGADAQGSTRLERGLSFFSRARETAIDRGFDFGWSLVVVPGVDHDHTLMARAAASLLAPSSPVAD